LSGLTNFFLFYNNFFQLFCFQPRTWFVCVQTQLRGNCFLGREPSVFVSTLWSDFSYWATLVVRSQAFIHRYAYHWHGTHSINFTHTLNYFQNSLKLRTITRFLVNKLRGSLDDRQAQYLDFGDLDVWEKQRLL
jgi:hypothetical protein